ncbi:hypothetical protein Tco_0736891 [Tanacetum coccineum]
MARQYTQPKRPRNAAWYKEKAMLAKAQEAGQILDEEQLSFLADPGIPAGQAQTIIPHNAAFHTEDLNTYVTDCDDLSTTQAVLMANISNYGSNVISEATVQDTNLQAQQDSMILSVIEQMSEQMINLVNNWEKANKEQNNETITAKLERYKERVKTFEQRLNIDLSCREKMIDSQMNDMIREKLALKEQVDSLEENLSKQIKEKQSLFKTCIVFKIKSKEKENKYMENEIDLEKKIKELDNIICKVGQSAQTVHMLTKPQAFYDNTHKQALVDVPSELPKVSLVNTSLKNLKFHLTQFDSVVKKRTKPNALEEDLLNEITEVQTVFDQMEVVVQQSSVDKQCLEIAKKEILLENDRLLQKIMSQDVLLTVMNSMSLNNDSVNMEMQKCESCEKCLNLDAELSKSKQAYNDFLKNYSQLEKHCISLEVSMQLKQEVFQNNESCVSQNAVEIPEYFEINDLKARLQDKDKTICKLKDTIKSLRENTKEQNVFKDQFDSIKQTRVRHKEQSDSLINKLNLKSMENEDLKAQIQDKVFVITSLKNNLQKLKGKEIVENVVHTPSATTIAPGMFKLDLVLLPPRLLQNRDAHIDYLRHTQEQANTLQEIVNQAKAKQPLDRELDFACVESSNTSDSNTHVLSSIGVNYSTSNCGTKPPGNKKNDRISQTPSRNKRNKVEAQPRKVNKTNRVVKPICDVDVKHSLSNANSENSLSSKQTTSHSAEIQKPEIKVYSRKPKNVKNIGSSKIAKIVESKNANHSEPNQTWGSNATDIPSSSSLVMTVVSNLFTKVIILYILSKEKSIPKRHNINTLKDDGVLRKLKFVSKGEDEQKYGNVNSRLDNEEEYKDSKAYLKYLALSISIELQKKGRGKGKGLIGKKATITPSKKGSITAEDNIILDPNVALKLGESISLTKAEEQEEQRRVHENHERIVTEKSTSNEESNEEEAAQLASDMQNATKSNKQEYRIQQQSTGSSEGAGITPEVPDEPKGSSAAQSDEDD